ncbi:hypothetical protein C8Q73DRAFT_787563 [Cubamyces lactineus]|nr:hypothetical protein C8Q73DRAFT_787563 [Cubamyces lactineus]
MFTRAFTRNLFFRRGQQVVEPNAENLKQRKSKSKSRSRSRSHSRQTRDVGNVLQPSSQNASAADCQEVVPSQGDDLKELSAKRSVQDLSTEGQKEDENCPVVAPPPAILEPHANFGSCHNVSLASQDVSGSFILLNPSDAVTKLGNEDEFPDEVFQTPTMGSEADEAASPSQTMAFTITESYSSGMIAEAVELEISSMPIPLLPVQGQGASSLAVPAMPIALIPRSLETGLSDITEADEPSMSERSLRPIEDNSVLYEVGAETGKTNLSFSSFGSSYASTPTQSANTSVILPEPTPASPLSVHQEVVCEGTADGRITPSVREHAVEEHVHLHPTLLSSMSPALRSVRGQSRTPVVVPTPTRPRVEDRAQTPLRTVSTVSLQEDSALLEKNPTEGLNIPTPATYAEAMNLALQYPEMSSKLLNEPLASACPTPARTASPVRGSARTGPASPAAAPQKSGPVHTADRPNWAVAPEEPRPNRRSRSRGRTKARKPVGPRGGEQGMYRSNGASAASQTPPGSTPNLSTRPLVSKPASEQQSPQKSRQAVDSDKGFARDFRKEKAEPWHNRVSTWVETTSSAADVSGTKQDASATASVGSNTNTTTSVSPEASGSVAKESAAPRSASSTRSPLNPNAPVWEYRPHVRTATDSTTGATKQPSPSIAPSPSGPPVPTLNQASPALDLEGDLARLRAMLRDCGLEERKLSERLSTPACSARASQHIQPAVCSEKNQAVPPGFGQGMHRPFAPTLQLNLTGIDSGRQRTQTHLPLAHPSIWQCTGPQALPSLFVPQPGGQIVYATSKPGANAIPIIMPQTGTPLFSLSNASAPVPTHSQPAQPTTSVAPSAVQPKPVHRTSQFPSSVPQQQPVGTRPSAASLTGNGNDKVFRFGQTGQQTGLTVISPKAVVPAALPQGTASLGAVSSKTSTSRTALLPPGGERSRPPVTGANAIVAPTTRFYGIETPRVVFDKHGWTVNSP